MSTHTMPAGRSRTPAIALIVGVLAAIAIATLAVADVTFSNPFTRDAAPAQQSVPSARDYPQPEWLKGYLQPKMSSYPQPEWLKGYLQPKVEAPAVSRHVNEGLR